MLSIFCLVEVIVVFFFVLFLFLETQTICGKDDIKCLSKSIWFISS